MKKYIIGSIAVLVIFCGILCVKLLVTGTKTQVMGATLINLEVPKLSLLANEEGEYIATFNSFRSVKSLEKEFEEMFLNYEMCFDDGNAHYYNKNNNTTILNYKIERGFILNKFTINYVKGNACK